MKYVSNNVLFIVVLLISGYPLSLSRVLVLCVPPLQPPPRQLLPKTYFHSSFLPRFAASSFADYSSHPPDPGVAISLYPLPLCAFQGL